MTSSVSKDACSRLSTPARIASMPDCALCTCAVTLMPAACASSTTASISSRVISGAPGSAPKEKTAPDAMTLRKSAPSAIAQARSLAKFVGAARNAGACGGRDIRRVVVDRDHLTAAAGYRQVGPASLDSRPERATGRDLVAAIDDGFREKVADIAHGRKAGQQRLLRPPRVRARESPRSVPL